MSSNSSNSFLVLIALEDMLGRERVRAMAENYLAYIIATSPVTPAPTPNPTPESHVIHIPPTPLLEELQPMPPMMPPMTPPLPPRPDTAPNPPGAPARRLRRNTPDCECDTPPLTARNLDEVFVTLTPPAASAPSIAGAASSQEENCPLHQHISRGGALGYSLNSAGQWSTFSPLGNGCGHCRR